MSGLAHTVRCWLLLQGIMKSLLSCVTLSDYKGVIDGLIERWGGVVISIGSLLFSFPPPAGGSDNELQQRLNSRMETIENYPHYRFNALAEDGIGGHQEQEGDYQRVVFDEDGLVYSKHLKKRLRFVICICMSVLIVAVTYHYPVSFT